MASFRRVAIDTVPIGAILKAPISDPDHPRIKLLGEGIEVTEAFLDRLRERGIRQVVIGTRDLAVIESFKPQGRLKQVPPAHQYVQSQRVNVHTERLDRMVESRESLELEEAAEPVSLSIHRPKNCSYPDGLQEQWAMEHDEQVESLAEVYEQADQPKADVGNVPELLRQQCEAILARLEEDSDALVCLAGTPFSSEYPTRHAVHVASMAMAMGVELDLDHSHLMELGMGCLIHDLGMRRVGLEAFHSKSPISRGALARLADHPVHTLEIAGKFGDRISDASKLVAYQMHERLDGSGYPRGCGINQIHFLARIAAVADEFVALLAPRPHRLGVQGYYAIKHILEETKLGKFDPRAVRALLQATGLFPIGSYVELTNDHVGRVIRTGGDLFDRPTIEMWPADQVGSKPTVVNLQEEESLQISGTHSLRRAA